MSFLAQKAFSEFLRFHDNVYQRTNGWIGHRMMLMPALLLHTVGAKTGQRRTAAVMSFPDGGHAWLVVA